jgi:predicted phosphodiesterase
MRGFNIGIIVLLLVSTLLAGATAAQTDKAPEPKPAGKITFAIVADNHFYYGDANDALFSATQKSLKLMQETLKPDFIVYLGDAISGEGTREITEQESFDLTNAFIKEVKQDTTIPFYNVWGNHDGPNFPKIYGYKNKAFSEGGYLFYLMGIELTNYWSGIGQFKDWKFLDDTIKGAPDETSFVFIHEPIFPPTFDNAMKVQKKIEKYPKIKVVFQGHTHVEQVNRAKGVLYFTCEAFHQPPGYSFYIVGIEGGTMKITRYDLTNGKYEPHEVLNENLK